MRRAAALYLVGASIAGFIVVPGFTLAGSTPPDWVLVIALLAIIAALIAFLHLKRTTPQEANGRR